MRDSIHISEVVPVGKETDRRWEEGEEAIMSEFTVQLFRGKMAVAGEDLRKRIVEYGIRATMRLTGLSQHTVESMINGKPVRRTTLERIAAALAGLPTET